MLLWIDQEVALKLKKIQRIFDGIYGEDYLLKIDLEKNRFRIYWKWASCYSEFYFNNLIELLFKIDLFIKSEGLKNQNIWDNEYIKLEKEISNLYERQKSNNLY